MSVCRYLNVGMSVLERWYVGMSVFQYVGIPVECRYVGSYLNVGMSVFECWYVGVLIWYVGIPVECRYVGT